MYSDAVLLPCLKGQGFMLLYSGSDLSYKVSGLQRNTEYRFRVCWGFFLLF